MNFDLFSPYVRVAMYSELEAPFKIKRRVIFDYELIFLAEGKWKLTVNETSYLCKKHDVLLLKPGIPHSIESVDAVCVSQPHIHFDLVYDAQSPQIFVSFLDLNQMTPQERCMIRQDLLPQLPSPFLKISNPDYFKQLLYSVIDCYSARQPLYQLEVKGKMLSLLAYIIRENSPVLPPERSSDSIIVLIKNFIDQNYCNEITLDSLQKQFHYNKFYIAKKFSEKFSCPLIHYYRSLRIEAAKRYLQAGLSVTEVAEKLNMSSIYAFSRFFKAKVGCSPSAYQTNDVNQ